MKKFLLSLALCLPVLCHAAGNDDQTKQWRHDFALCTHYETMLRVAIGSRVMQMSPQQAFKQLSDTRVSLRGFPFPDAPSLTDSQLKFIVNEAYFGRFSTIDSLPSIPCHELASRPSGWKPLR